MVKISSPRSNALPGLQVDRVLGEEGIPRDTEDGRKEFAQRMELRRAQKEPEDYERLRRGWCLGGEEFRQELLATAEGRAGANHYGADRHESGERKAERLVAEGLKTLGWDEKELALRRKGDKGKVKLARRLRAQTTMTRGWIAQRLCMGSWTYTVNLIYEKRAQRKSINIKD